MSNMSYKILVVTLSLCILDMYVRSCFLPIIRKILKEVHIELLTLADVSHFCSFMNVKFDCTLLPESATIDKRGHAVRSILSWWSQLMKSAWKRLSLISSPIASKQITTGTTALMVHVELCDHVTVM